MHRKILEDATMEQLEKYLDDQLMLVKQRDYEMYEELEIDLYKEVYGCHFNDWMLEKALKKMVNEDGTYGGHWTVEQTNSVAKNMGISFTNFNEYDFNYVMNMLYSDYYGAVNNDPNTYARMAKKFLDDKDAYGGKAFRYYLAMKKD